MRYHRRRIAAAHAIRAHAAHTALLEEIAGSKRRKNWALTVVIFSGIALAYTLDVYLGHQQLAIAVGLASNGLWLYFG